LILSFDGAPAYARSGVGGEPSDLPSIKVMSLNLHKGMDQNGTKILDGDLALFNIEQPDLIALQEVLSSHIKTFISAGYRVIYGPNLNLLPFHFGNVVLTRHPVLYHRHHYLPSQLEPRGVDEAALDIDGQVVTVLNTHLGLQRNERANQFTEIQRIIECIPGPVILMGDFNTEPSDNLFTDFKNRFWEIGDGTPGAKTCPASHPNRRLDQIWYNDYLGLIRGSVLPWLVSDHLPIQAEFNLLKANPVPQTELVIPAIPQAIDSLSSLSELDSPEFQLGAAAESGSKFNQGYVDALFTFNLKWALISQ
jgi:endonuclease/exonuclease/phosphatase family metal-dependent hydrolase